MKLKAICPQCQRALIIPTAIAGKKARCSACQFVFRVQAVRTPSESSIESGLYVDEAVSQSELEPTEPTPSDASRSDTAHSPIDRPEAEFASELASAVSPSDEPWETQSIGRFQVRQRLGEGGFGIVLQVYDPILDRLVALKMMRSGSSMAERSQRMLREAKAAARLRHPNIVAVYEVGEDQKQAYIASQFIPGTTLAEIIKAENKIPHDHSELRTFIGWLIELCRALAYAHREGITHRDVKPHNVLIDEQSHAQLTDFGLAHQQLEGVSQQRQLVGTPAYMSPEQVRGDQSQVGPASDQYSVGVILFEILTGRRPFKGDSHSLLSSIVHEPIPRPSSLAGSVPHPLEQICLKVLSREPEGRYLDCDAFADDLQRWLDGELVLAGHPGLIDHTLHWAKKRPHLAGWIAAAAAGLAMLGGTSATIGLTRLSAARSELEYRNGELAETQETLALVSSEAASRDSELSTVRVREKANEYARNLDEAVVALNANDLAKVHRVLDRVPWKERGIEHNLLRRRAMGTPYVLHAGESVSRLSWSHDGGLLLAVTENSSLRFWDGVDLKPLTSAKLGALVDAQFHPYRMELLTLHNPGGTATYEAQPSDPSQRNPQALKMPLIRKWKVNLDKDRVQLSLLLQTESEIAFLRSAAFHPDGETFAVCGRFGVEIRNWNLAGLEVSSRPQAIRAEIAKVAYTQDGNRLDCQSLTFGDEGCHIYTVDTDHPDGLDTRTQPESHSHGKPGFRPDIAPWVVNQAPLVQPNEKAFPDTHYFQGSVLCFEGSSLQAGNRPGPTCAIETAADHYFVGYHDGHVVDGTVERVGHLQPISTISKHPNQTYVATADRGGDIRIWPMTSRTPEGAQMLTRLPDGSRLHANSDGRLIAGTVALPGATILTIWHTQTGEVAFELSGHTQGIHAIDFHPNRDEVLTVDGNGVFRIWNLDPSPQGTKVIRRWESDDTEIRQVCFDESGDTILVLGEKNAEVEEGAAGGLAIIVNAADGAIVREFSDIGSPVISGLFVPHSDSVIIATTDASLRSFSSESGEMIGEFDIGDRLAIDLAATASQLVAVLAEPCAWPSATAASVYESQLRSWTLPDGEELFDIDEPGVTYRFVDIDAALDRILVQVRDSVRIHDATTGQQLFADQRYPAVEYFSITQSYPVQKPVFETKEEVYKERVPVVVVVEQSYEVKIPYLATVSLQGTRSKGIPNEITCADAPEEGAVAAVMDKDGNALLAPEQIARGVIFEQVAPNRIRLSYKSDDEKNAGIENGAVTELPLAAPVAESETVFVQVAVIQSRTETRSRMVPKEVEKEVLKTRRYTVKNIVCEFRTREIPGTRVASTAHSKAIFLPDGRGIAVGGPNQIDVAHTSIPSWPLELVASECRYELVVSNQQGTLIAAAGQSGTCQACGCNCIDIWQAESGELATTIRLPNASAGDLAFDPVSGALLVGLSCVESDAEGNQTALLVFDPESGQLQRSLPGPATIQRVLTSSNADDPVVILADGDGKLYRVSPDIDAISELPIACPAPATIEISNDGRLICFQNEQGRSVVVPLDDPTRSVLLPEPWNHLHFNLAGTHLIAKPQPGDLIPDEGTVSKHDELVTGSWSIDQIIDALQAAETPVDLGQPAGVPDSVISPAMATTLVQETSVADRTTFNPLHHHVSLAALRSNHRIGQPASRNGRVLSIADAYLQTEQAPNHVVVWAPQKDAAAAPNRIDSSKTRLWARLSQPEFSEIAVPSDRPSDSDGVEPAGDPQPVNNEEPSDVGSGPYRLSVTSFSGDVRSLRGEELLVYSPPGERFRVDWNVHYEVPTDTKLAANFRLSRNATFLDDSQRQWLQERHAATQHFDTQSRGGYEDVSGEGQLKFGLIGVAPEKTGVFRFDADVGLYAKESFATLQRETLKVAVVTDIAAWRRRYDRSLEPMHSPVPVPTPVPAPEAVAPRPIPIEAAHAVPTRSAPLPIEAPEANAIEPMTPPSKWLNANRWTVDQKQNARGSVSVDGDTVTLQARSSSAMDSDLAASQSGLGLEPGRVYRLSFQIDSPESVPVGIEATGNKSPLPSLGFGQLVRTTPDPNQQSFLFHISNALAENDRLTFSFGSKVGTVHLRDLKLERAPEPSPQELVHIQISQIFRQIELLHYRETQEPWQDTASRTCMLIHQLRRLVEVCGQGIEHLDAIDEHRLAESFQERFPAALQRDLQNTLIVSSILKARGKTPVGNQVLAKALGIIAKELKTSPAKLELQQQVRQLLVMRELLFGQQDLPRQALERVRKHFASVGLCTANGELLNVKANQPLPDQPFDIVSLELSGKLGQWQPAIKNEFPMLVEFSSSAEDLTDNHIASLKSALLLQKLVISRSKTLSGRTLPTFRLPLLRQVEFSELNNSLATEAAIGLARWTAVTKLTLGPNLGISEQGWQRLSQMRQVKCLTLERTFPQSAWFQNLIGNLVNLQRLTLRGFMIENDVCRSIAELPDLKHLDASSTLIDDSGLRHLRGCGIEKLVLAATPVTDGCIDVLASMEQLAHLELRETCVSDAIFAVAGKWNRLGRIVLTRSRIDEERRQTFAAKNPSVSITLHTGNPLYPDDRAERDVMRELKRRGLRFLTDEEGHAIFTGWRWWHDGRPVMDEDAPLIAKLRNLESIQLGYESQFTAIGLRQLQNLKNLEVINAHDVSTLPLDSFALLGDCPIRELKVGGHRNQKFAERSFLSLPNWPTLEVLEIGAGDLTQRVIDKLAALPNLTSLRVANSLTDETFPYFARRMDRLQKLSIANTTLSKPAFAAIAQMGQLRELQLFSSRLPGSSLLDLRGLPIETLDFSAMTIPENFLAGAPELKQLKTIKLRTCKLSDDQFRRLYLSVDRSVVIETQNCDLSQAVIDEYQATRRD